MKRIGRANHSVDLPGRSMVGVMNKKTDRRTERRKYPRFQVVNRAIATLGEEKLGIVTDISRDGLAFYYVTFGTKENTKERNGSVEVSVANHKGFFLLNFPCKIVVDEHLMPNSKIISLKMKKCRIQFSRLTPDKLRQLEYFIAHYTISPVAGLKLAGMDMG